MDIFTVMLRAAALVHVSVFLDSAVAGVCAAWYNYSVGMFCIINGGALWQAKNAQATIRS